MQDKRPTNSKEKPHGHWELYWSNGQLLFNRYYINGVLHGYEECYWSDSELAHKHYYAR